MCKKPGALWFCSVFCNDIMMGHGLCDGLKLSKFIVNANILWWYLFRHYIDSMLIDFFDILFVNGGAEVYAILAPSHKSTRHLANCDCDAHVRILGKKIYFL